MPNLNISPADDKDVRAAYLLLKKQRDISLPDVEKVALGLKLSKVDDRIRQLATDQLEAVDDYTKIGKAKKVSDAIAQAAKYAGAKDDKEEGVVKTSLKPSMIRDSMRRKPGEVGGEDKPEDIVRKAGSWKKVKELYIVKGKEDTMRLLLQYRIDEVGRIYKQVIDQMWNDNEPKRSAYNRDKSSVPKNEVFQLNDLQFSMMGSTDLTSDYDVSFDHNVEKPWVGTTAVKLFNQKFRAKWGKEAGTVFDTNVYTQGFMPSDMSNIPAGVERSIKGRIDKVTKQMETDPSTELAALKTRLEQQAKTAARVREQMAQDAIDNRGKTRVTDALSQKKVFEIEDLMSLVKIRKFMKPAEWDEYSKLLLAGLPGGPAREAAESVLKQADETFAALNKQLEDRMAKLREGRTDADEADLELEASNRLYEEYLERAGAIVAENKGMLQGKAVSDWTQEQSSALYFANEAYHTSGPVESTVIGQQMGIAMKQVAEQHLQAINEQTGFVIEQHEHGFVADDPEEGGAPDDPGRFNRGRFLWKSAKYVDRICSILEQIKKDIGPTALKDPKDAAELKRLSTSLLAIKKGEGSDTQKDALAVTAAGDADVRKMVLELNADVNQQLRGGNAGPVPTTGGSAEQLPEPTAPKAEGQGGPDQQIVEGVIAQLQKEVEARAGLFELDQSYNENPEELKEKAAALEAITKTLTTRIRDGLPYSDALKELDDKIGQLAREMDKKYVRTSSARELQRHAKTVAPEGGWESAYELAVNEMKEGATLEKAKADLAAMLQIR